MLCLVFQQLGQPKKCWLQWELCIHFRTVVDSGYNLKLHVRHMVFCGLFFQAHCQICYCLVIQTSKVAVNCSPTNNNYSLLSLTSTYFVALPLHFFSYSFSHRTIFAFPLKSNPNMNTKGCALLTTSIASSVVFLSLIKFLMKKFL